METDIHSDLNINSQRSLLIIAKTWNKTNKNIHQQENGNSDFSVVMECYYSALQKKELILIHPTKWINLQAWCCPKEIRNPHPLRIITDWFNQTWSPKTNHTQLEILVRRKLIDQKMHEDIFWGDGYAPCLILGASYMCISTCHNSLNCTFESCAFFSVSIKPVFKNRESQNLESVNYRQLLKCSRIKGIRS